MAAIHAIRRACDALLLRLLPGHRAAQLRRMQRISAIVDAEMRRITRRHLIPYFDGMELDVRSEFGETEIGAKECLAAFLSKTSGDRNMDSRHVASYCRDMEDYCGPFKMMEGYDPSFGEGIWRHVRPQSISIERYPERPNEWFAALEAWCEWEPEHGLAMVWWRGGMLTFVGPDTGSFENGGMTYEGRPSGIIYDAFSPAFTTRTED